MLLSLRSEQLEDAVLDPLLVVGSVVSRVLKQVENDFLISGNRAHPKHSSQIRKQIKNKLIVSSVSHFFKIRA